MDIKFISQLLKFAANTSLTEIALKIDGDELNVKWSEPVYVSNLQSTETPMVTNEELKTLAKAPESKIRSPAVGRIVMPFSNKQKDQIIGTEVKSGDNLCTIIQCGQEIDVNSKIDGIIEEVLVANDETVDYGKVLFVLK